MALENTIVHGDTGGSEIGGFGGGITVSSSDVCSGTAPYTGTANICADPELADVATSDVHETASSPTIDAGLNADVPAGATTDVYGQKRIVGTKQAAGIVDIGAAERQTAFKPPTPPPTGPGTVKVSDEHATSNGIDVTITCGGATTQSCDGNATAATTETAKGGKVIAVAASEASAKRHKRTLTMAHKSYRLTGGKQVTLKLTLTGKGQDAAEAIRQIAGHGQGHADERHRQAGHCLQPS